MRILHITCVRELTSGQRKQLVFEYDASKKLGISWDIVALHTGEIKDNRFEVQIPKYFRSIFVRNLYSWLYMLRLQKNYDVIINRHMTFDPFVLIFGWFIKNRLSLHHAKEIAELKLIRKGWQGKLASSLEKTTGFISLKQIKGAICVTNDIAQYQQNRSNIKTFLYPNGINLSTIKVIEDKRIDNQINIAFMCGTFSAWHGLDILLESVLENLEFIKIHNVKIHLIGVVLEEDFKFICTNKLNIILHGVLSSAEYIEVLQRCDIGIDSLALNRKFLTEAAALKVREYLAYGLPIFSAYKDTAIPEYFDFYKIGNPNMKEIVFFANQMKLVTRQQVREASEKFIDKEILLKKLFNDLNEYIKL